MLPPLSQPQSTDLPLQEPYTPKEAAAGFIALAGVLLVARPPFLFGKKVTEPILGAQSAAFDAASLTWYYTMPSALQTAGITVPSHYPQQQQQLPSPAERSAAVLVAILGTFAAAVAYSTIRIIGRRTHSLISVNYFAVIATLGSAVLILVHPDLHFVMPRGVVQWYVLFALFPTFSHPPSPLFLTRSGLEYCQVIWQWRPLLRIC